ncbi:hypothetical protein Prudu_018625 [Prunus dulcis]|uniref:Uncharacterized protein n=1 Tax=Prunus dulcis TaxID=3755 RepID=A0A4Y1RSF4_PRUDU|nr:hypothetical protein Prudu_018625 [Prunus dulcis]
MDFSLFLSLSRRTLVVRPFAFNTTARPPQAEPISAAGTIGSASLSSSKPDRPPPLGRPELIGKPCFPTEVRPSPPDFLARISPRFSTKSIEHQGSGRTAAETFEGRRSARDPHRAIQSFRVTT